MSTQNFKLTFWIIGIIILTACIQKSKEMTAQQTTYQLARGTALQARYLIANEQGEK